MEGKTNFLLEYVACLEETKEEGEGEWKKQRYKFRDSEDKVALLTLKPLI